MKSFPFQSGEFKLVSVTMLIDHLLLQRVIKSAIKGSIAITLNIIHFIHQILLKPFLGGFVLTIRGWLARSKQKLKDSISRVLLVIITRGYLIKS